MIKIKLGRFFSQIVLHYAAKRAVLCGKTRCIMRQNALHYAAKTRCIMRQNRPKLFLNNHLKLNIEWKKEMLPSLLA